MAGGVGKVAGFRVGPTVLRGRREALRGEGSKQQIPGGNDRKKGKGNGKGLDAKDAKVATFRNVERATARAEADSQRE